MEFMRLSNSTLAVKIDDEQYILVDNYVENNDRHYYYEDLDIDLDFSNSTDISEDYQKFINGEKAFYSERRNCYIFYYNEIHICYLREGKYVEVNYGNLFKDKYHRVFDVIYDLANYCSQFTDIGVKMLKDVLGDEYFEMPPK